MAGGTRRCANPGSGLSKGSDPADKMAERLRSRGREGTSCKASEGGPSAVPYAAISSSAMRSTT